MPEKSCSRPDSPDSVFPDSSTLMIQFFSLAAFLNFRMNYSFKEQVFLKGEQSALVKWVYSLLKERSSFLLLLNPVNKTVEFLWASFIYHLQSTLCLRWFYSLSLFAWKAVQNCLIQLPVWEVYEAMIKHPEFFDQPFPVLYGQQRVSSSLMHGQCIPLSSSFWSRAFHTLRSYSVSNYRISPCVHAHENTK